MSTPRYCPQRKLPPAPYRPGSGARPSQPEEGLAEELVVDGEESLRKHADYLWGIDLFNHGYYWEAHEAWEGLWRANRREPCIAAHLQGLIQCAAAMLKADMGQERGRARLLRKAEHHLLRAGERKPDRVAGICAADLLSSCRRFQPKRSATRPCIRLV